MTESEWLAGDDTNKLFEVWKRKKKRATPRVQRLLACGLCRLLWERLEDMSRRAVEAAEGYADGTVSLADLTAAHDAGVRHNRSRFDKVGMLYGRSVGVDHGSIAAQKFGWEAAEGASRPGRPVPGRATVGIWMLTFVEPERRTHKRAFADRTRCVVGNPFRPAAFDPAWRTSTVLGLAEAIYADRAFDRMPILADALEEAGCDDAAALAHCREANDHCRGCWVLDAVAGRE